MTVNPPRLPAISIRQVLWMAATTLLFIPLALFGVSLDDVWHILQQSDWRPVALAVILFVLTLAAKAARWQVLFERPPAFDSMFAALVIGQAGNFMLPARLGDVMRVYVLGRREGKPAALTIGTIAAEKLVELIVLIGLAGARRAVCASAWLALGAIGTARRDSGIWSGALGTSIFTAITAAAAVGLGGCENPARGARANDRAI